MEIEIDIGKGHVVVFGLFLILLVGSFVFATGWTEADSFSTELKSDKISGYSGEIVEFADGLIIEGNLVVPTSDTWADLGETTSWRTNSWADCPAGKFVIGAGLDDDGGDEYRHRVTCDAL